MLRMTTEILGTRVRDKSAQEKKRKRKTHLQKPTAKVGHPMDAGKHRRKYFFTILLLVPDQLKEE
jgi:hypothetical protein